MVTELPAGGGAKGGLGGNSVGLGPGVPVPAVGTGEIVPEGISLAVGDLAAVLEGLGVFVTGPIYGPWVSVISGPGYGPVAVNSGPG